jgi:hypothetical protein
MVAVSKPEKTTEEADRSKEPTKKFDAEELGTEELDKVSGGRMLNGGLASGSWQGCSSARKL